MKKTSCEHVESIAYSQTNLQRFPSFMRTRREHCKFPNKFTTIPSFKSFANVAMHAFSSGKSAAKVTQYAVRLDDYTKTRANIFTWWLS